MDIFGTMDKGQYYCESNKMTGMNYYHCDSFKEVLDKINMHPYNLLSTETVTVFCWHHKQGYKKVAIISFYGD